MKKKHLMLKHLKKIIAWILMMPIVIWMILFLGPIMLMFEALGLLKWAADETGIL